ncbi:MAG: hypothetical protein E6Q50_04885 [Lysobacter sp.]|nr:MAG: hypothetical protein E6Q50_04885 [Lysobacter sp.]
MTSDFKITFGADLPPMVVEAVSPDQSILKRLMIKGGQQQTVSTSKKASFLRVHLPSGKYVTLNEPGILESVVTMDALRAPRHFHQYSWDLSQSSSSEIPVPQHVGLQSVLDETRLRDAMQSYSGRDLASRQELRRYHVWRTAVTPTKEFEDKEVSLGSYARAWLESCDHSRWTAVQVSQAREAVWDVGGPPFDPPLELNVRQDDGRKLLVRIPGNANRLWARADRLTVEKSLVYSVRVETTEPVADTILNYLSRGDLEAANAMSGWADKSARLIGGKMADPYAAAVGGYLLLKMQRFDKMRDWARNLADHFDFLPDGCVIWAAQLIRQDPSNVSEIKAYLLQAAERGLPVYTPGLRILMDNLRIMGDDGEIAFRNLRKQLGQVIWDSPLTAYMSAEHSSSRTSLRSEAITFDIAFGAKM